MAEEAATTSSSPALAAVSIAIPSTIIAVPIGSRRSSVDGRQHAERLNAICVDANRRERLRLLTVGDLRLQHDAIACELLNDGEESGVEKSDLEEHQKRQRAVD